MSNRKMITFVSVGALGAGILASACCVLPVLFAIIGAGSVGFAAFLGPVRPYLLVVAYGCIGLGFYFVNAKKAACEEGSACEKGTSKRYTKIALWILLLVVTLFATFPYWFEWFV